jgi:hypothetical protein
VTCSDEHANDLKNARRRLRDLGRCRFCNRPSTPEERASYAAWRKTLPESKRGPKPKSEEHKAASKKARAEKRKAARLKAKLDAQSIPEQVSA